MTAQNAKKFFETFKVLLSESNADSMLSYATEASIEALEKQTPKAPKVEKYFYGKYYLCPSCGQNVKEGECCRNNECGQLIDWEEENK